ncbi:MAG TPA: histidinol dehydrogenase [Thermoanaerobaculia bacterium]|nr:histidinol dehydrogenase [Thermoanaerobaculia bacterium]
MRVYKANSPDGEAALRDVVERRNASNENALRVADAMIAGVRARGDAFVAEQIAKFDGVTLAPDSIKVAPREVTTEIADAIDTAIARIDAFHRPQLPQAYRWGAVAHRVRPIRRVGCYVPGGRAVYISTLMMTAVPARIAGVEEIVCITTPAAAERDELHYVCNRLGIREIYRCGGAAGVAAAALGTESLARVDKIVGPGNAYVTAAKTRLIGEVGIDMTAGPTELIVIADESADAALVIADLLAQAEHGPDSEVILLTTSRALAEKMPDRAIAFVVDSLDEAVTIADRIAPEHLSIHARDAEGIAEKARNCAAIYCGASSPPAAGDYVVGSNHVLPTAGSARFFSPLGVYDFVKRSNVVSLTAAELAAIAPLGERIAEFEGLPAHAKSIAARRDACLAAS